MLHWQHPCCNCRIHKPPKSTNESAPARHIAFCDLSTKQINCARIPLQNTVPDFFCPGCISLQLSQSPLPSPQVLVAFQTLSSANTVKNQSKATNWTAVLLELEKGAGFLQLCFQCEQSRADNVGKFHLRALRERDSCVKMKKQECSQH